MAKSIIVYGVKGGKTRFAQRIAEHFGLKNHQAHVLRMYCEGSIGFVESEAAGKDWAQMGFETRSFQSVADEINALIPLTDWQSGPPPMVGEYDTFAENDRGYMWRRYWNGNLWSLAFRESDTEVQRNNTAARLQSLLFFPAWRGLSAEPIKVTE